MPKTPISEPVGFVSGPTNSHARHIAVGTIQGFSASALSLPTGLVTAAFLSRHLGPANYGLLTVATAVIVWIQATVSLGFSRTAVKFVAEAADWRTVGSSVLQAQLVFSLAAATLLMVGAPALASCMYAPELTGYLRLYAVNIPIYALGAIHGSILTGRGYFGRRALLSASYWLSRMIFVLLFVGLYPSITAAILAFIGASTVLLMEARVFIRPQFLRHSTFPLHNLWEYAWPLFFYTVSMNLFHKLDLFFVKALSGLPEAAGFYGAAQNLAIVPGLFAASFSPVLLAKQVLTSNQGQEESARMIAKQAMRVAFCLLPMAGMAAGAAPEVIMAIYGPSFLPAAPLLALLIFAAVGSIVISVAASTLIAAGKPKLLFVLTTPLVPLAVGSHFIMVPRFGPIAAAAGTTALTCLGACAIIIAVYGIWKLLPPASTLGRSILVCIFAYVLASYWAAPGVSLFLKLPAIALTIVLIFFLLGEFSGSDVSFLRSMLPWRRVVE